MDTARTVDIDLDWVEELTKRETEALDRKHARSLTYREEAKRFLPGGVSSSWQSWPPHPIYVRRGEGSLVWDIDGNEYVDLHNGYGVMVMGHAHPKVVEAVQRRVAEGTHFAQPTEEALPVAENLAERYRLPQWRFGNSGTEATLDACRITRATTGRKKILKIEGTYHGHHDSLMVSVFPSEEEAGPREHPASVPQTKGLPKEFVDLVVNVPFNDLQAAKEAFAEHAGEFACMIVEPAMTNCGLVLPDPGYLAGLKDLCQVDGALFVFDEVKTGFTLAWGGAVEAFGVVPDLVCLAKALGAGLPCGAIGGTDEAMGMVVRGELDQQGTFNGNPLTMAAAKANLLEVLTPDAYARFDELNAILAALRGRVPLAGPAGEFQGPRSEGLRRVPARADPRVPRPLGHRRQGAAARLAVAAEPRRVQVTRIEVGELDDLDRALRRRRAALRRQPRGVRGHGDERGRLIDRDARGAVGRPLLRSVALAASGRR